MDTLRRARYGVAEPNRPFSSDDQVPAHGNPFLSSDEGVVTIPNTGTKPARAHSNSRDSGIDMDEGAISRDQEPERLQDRLFSALIQSYQEKRGFFAKDQLSRILTESRVRNELAEHFDVSLPEEVIAQHAKTICHGASPRNESSERDDQPNTRTFIKIFAILVIIEKTESIIKLLEEGVNDSDLPLIKVSRQNDENMFDLRLRRRPDLILKSFQRRWNQLNIRNFDEWQWTTIPVEFAPPTELGQVKHYELQEQRILPFVKDSRDHKPHFSRRTELEGGFASVFRVAIHSKHHHFPIPPGSSDPAFFAIKRLHSQNREAFMKEAEMLNKFSSDKHNHLISLLATYEQFDRFFLIFDWAEADLQAYWRKVNPSPSFDLKTVLWMAKQCKGIASGIIQIHQHESVYAKEDPDQPANKNVVFGHHGDIKPENVLWFAEPGHEEGKVGGTLKLSDFGLAEVSIHRTISMAPKSKWGVSLGYRAPEADLKQGAAIGRSYDIWTLGCLYLEFITWILGGSKLLDEFLEVRKARDATWHDIETHTFFRLEVDGKTGEPTAVIKPAVKQFIRNLHSHPRCSQFIHDFLTMVEESLLVVKTNNQHGMDRFDIKQVHHELASMLEKFDSNTYIITPVPK